MKSDDASVTITPAAIRAIDPEIASVASSIKNAQMWLHEAQNAARYITPYLSMPDGARVLEVGSGAGILLGDLARNNPSLEFAGIEPVGSGFESLRPFIEAIRKLAPFQLFEGGYEEFSDDRGFDLIFLINVFEHLQDWRHFLGFARDLLKPGGKCVILCPNYGLPYESHYHIPVVFNKKLTKVVFSKYIRSFDRKYDCEGLWDSLNFVKYAEVRRYLEGSALRLRFNPDISFDFIDRLKHDPEFASRQRKLSFAVKMFEGLRLRGVFRRRPFWRYHPYMHLELSKAVQ